MYILKCTNSTAPISHSNPKYTQTNSTYKPSCLSSVRRLSSIHSLLELDRNKASRANVPSFPISSSVSPPVPVLSLSVPQTPVSVFVFCCAEFMTLERHPRSSWQSCLIFYVGLVASFSVIRFMIITQQYIIIIFPTTTTASPATNQQKVRDCGFRIISHEYTYYSVNQLSVNHKFLTTIFFFEVKLFLTCKIIV